MNNSKELNDVCIDIYEASYLTVSNINIGNAAKGIRFFYENTFDATNVTVKNCDFSGVYGIFWDTPSQAFYGHSAAISVESMVGNAFEWGDVALTGMTIKDCYCTDSANFFAATSKIDDEISGNYTYEQKLNIYTIKNLSIKDCKMEKNRYYGTTIGSVKGGAMENCVITNNGTKELSVGTAALMFSRLNDFTVRDCIIEYQNRLSNNPDGCGIDFEANCHNVTVTDCEIRYNDGVGIMFYDNATGIYNTNCTIKNNNFTNNNQNVLDTDTTNYPKYAEIYIVDESLKGTDNYIGNNTYKKQTYGSSGEEVSFINDYTITNAEIVIENNIQHD